MSLCEPSDLLPGVPPVGAAVTQGRVQRVLDECQPLLQCLLPEVRLQDTQQTEIKLEVGQSISSRGDILPAKPGLEAPFNEGQRFGFVPLHKMKTHQHKFLF